MSGSISCPICINDFAAGADVTVLVGGHFFHPSCLTPWLQSHGSCPVCSLTEIIEDRTFTGAVVLETDENGDITTRAIGMDDILAAYDEAPEPLNDKQIDDLPVLRVDEALLGQSRSCPICFDNLAAGAEVTVLECGHFFHPSCLTPWLQRHGSCPVCRQALF